MRQIGLLDETTSRPSRRPELAGVRRSRMGAENGFDQLGSLQVHLPVRRLVPAAAGEEMLLEHRHRAV